MLTPNEKISNKNFSESSSCSSTAQNSPLQNFTPNLLPNPILSKPNRKIIKNKNRKKRFSRKKPRIIRKIYAPHNTTQFIIKSHMQNNRIIDNLNQNEISVFQDRTHIFATMIGIFIRLKK